MRMIKIDLLKNNPHAVPAIANIWYEVLGKIWMPITYIALHGAAGIPVGACKLELNGGIRPDLTSWIWSLIRNIKNRE